MINIDDLIVSLDLDNKTIQELFDLLETVSQTEINNTKSISVLPLPTVVRDKEAELKRRMIDIVVNDEKGAYAVLNHRIAIIKAITERIKKQLGEDLIPNADDKYSLGNADNYWKEAYINLANLWETHINSLYASVARIESLEVEYLKGLVIPMADDEETEPQLGSEEYPFAKIVAKEISNSDFFSFNRAEGDSLEVGEISYCGKITECDEAKIKQVNSDYVNVNYIVDTTELSASSVESVEAKFENLTAKNVQATNTVSKDLQTDTLKAIDGTINRIKGNTLEVGVESYLRVTESIATYKGSEIGTKEDLSYKYDTSAHNEFANNMNDKHNQMVLEHNNLASNLQAQINLIKETLASDDTALDSFREIIAVLKSSTADIEALFNQLATKADKSYVDAQNMLDRTYTDTQVSQARTDFADQMQNHEARTQSQISELEAQFKAFVEEYVGTYPQVIDAMVGDE